MLPALLCSPSKQSGKQSEGLHSSCIRHAAVHWQGSYVESGLDALDSLRLMHAKSSKNIAPQGRGTDKLSNAGLEPAAVHT